MRTPVPEYLQDLLDDLRDKDEGAVADYIPALATADPEVFGVAATTVEGRTYSAGADDQGFSIQSISKPFAYAAALGDRGFDVVLEKIGVEPSGEAFNELSLEEGSHRPRNPMINAGAITAHHLLVGAGASRRDRVDRLLQFFSVLAGRKLRIDQEVFESEMDTADRNLAIAHMLRNYGVLDDDPHDVVTGYTAQCAINVTVRDLALMGATLANTGVHPITGERAVTEKVARQTLSLMAAAGMYDAAGSWLTEVGIPAKSGVSGGMLGALPGQVGIGVLSPRLDKYGNSVRGVQVCQRLSDDMGLHLLEAEAYGSTSVRSIHSRDKKTTIELQGVIQFTGAETLLHYLHEAPLSTDSVIFDLSRVHRLSDVGRRMTLEAMRRLKLDGHTIELVDPDSVLPDPDMGDGTYPFSGSAKNHLNERTTS